MARYWFGAGIADWTMTTQDAVGGFDDMVQTVSGVAITVWNAETGGTQYTDLLDATGVAVATVTSSDGSDGRAAGTIPPFQGPDGVTEVWASAGGGPRQRMTGHLGEAVQQAVTAAAAAQAGLQAHLDVSNRNPHGTATTHLIDFSDVTAADGMVPVWDAGLGEWVPTTATGLTAADFVQTAGGSEIVIPIGDITTRALGIRLPPGDRSGAANTYEIVYNAGTEASPVWVVVTSLDGYGGLRGKAPRNDRPYGRVAQYSTSQTANLWEWTDANGNVLSSVGPLGQYRAPNIAITPTWSQDTATAGTGTYRFYNPTGTALTLRGFIVSAGGTAPNGDFIINPKLDGVAVYASANRPKIVAGGRTSGLVTTLSTTTWPAGSYLTVDVDTVPSTAPTKVTIQAVAY